jgi:membrane protein implicated in regulation of membrane protease activity
MQIQIWQIYAVIGFLCLTAEMVTPSFYLAPIGVAALITVGTSFFIDSVTWQLVIMAALAIALYFTLTPFARARFNRKPAPTGVGIVGQAGTVKHAPESAVKPGQILVYADTWDIFWDDNDTAYVTFLRSLTAGARVRIKEVRGNRVIVERIDS